MISSQGILAANGFRRRSLTVADVWALYGTRYPVSPGMRLPNSCGWKMTVNGIGILLAPTPETDH
jgi:hypothetical protein